MDKEYQQWVETLIDRYRLCQVRAAVKVNTEQLIYNFLLGRDIVEMHVEERWGEGVIDQLSKDLKKAMPTAEGLSSTNLRYCRRFYLLYSKTVEFCPQLGGKIQPPRNKGGRTDGNILNWLTRGLLQWASLFSNLY